MVDAENKNQQYLLKLCRFIFGHFLTKSKKILYYLSAINQIMQIKIVLILFHNRINKMEEARQLFYDHKLVFNNVPLRRTPLDKEQIAAHCRKDHISPTTFTQKKNQSCYTQSYSPPKLYPNYNRPKQERELQIFRKKQNQSSTPHLPTITDKTQYQNLYKASPEHKVTQSKQKQSWFLKMDWASKPTSNYQTQFSKKGSPNFNSLNKLRVNYNNLHVYDLQANPKEMSLYSKDFRMYEIKPDLRISIGNKDHLAGKQNYLNKKGLSGHEKKYSSGIEQIKKQKPVLAIVKNHRVLRISKESF